MRIFQIVLEPGKGDGELRGQCKIEGLSGNGLLTTILPGIKESEFTEQYLTLAAGTRFVLYSDGVSEFG